MALLELSPLFRDGFGYPSYDIMKVDDDNFQITLAVPGYSRDDISIETREQELWVRGNRQVDASQNQYLYRSIASGAFERRFRLPEHVKVRGARMQDGLLHIDLVRELPEELRPRHVPIDVVGQATLIEDSTQTAIEDTSRAA